MKKNILMLGAGIAALTCSFVVNAGNGTWTTENIGGFSLVKMYTPSTTSPVGNGKSLLVVLHGCSQSYTAFTTANLEDAADQYGMVIAAPDAMNKSGFSCWAYWDGTKSRTYGDYKNVITLAEDLRDDASYDIDPAQIYVAGLSSGGAFAMTVGCLAPDIFAGMGLDAAPSTGTSSSGSFSLESTAAATATRCEGYAGSYSSYFDTQITNTAYGTSDYTVPKGYGPQNADAMASIYGVTKIPGTTTVLGDSGAQETLYTDGRVSMIELSGVSHAWPGGTGASGSYIDNSSINYGVYLAQYFAENNVRLVPDVDTDGDGVLDKDDAFPNDPNETKDTDGDGVGDNADAFPTDGTETVDTDGDGVGDNADAYPNDPNKWEQEPVDTDGDGVLDADDAFPNDPNETTDTDGDGVGDNGDAFPNDTTETADTDGDGVGDNADAYPEDPSKWEEEVAECSAVTGTVNPTLVNAGLVKKIGFYYYTTGDSQLVWSWLSYTLYQGSDGKGYKIESLCN